MSSRRRLIHLKILKDGDSHLVTSIILILLALLLLFFGAEFLVRGGSSLALRAGLSPLLVGLTIVAFGTSSPELVVSVKSALAQQGDISIGNVIGSNSFNIGIILGLTALICPIPVHHQIIKFDGPIALAVAGLLLVFLRDGLLTRFEGFVLFLGIIAYTVANVVIARREAQATLDAKNPDTGEGSGEPLFARKTQHWVFDFAYIVGGLGILIVGSQILVDSSVSLAKEFGVSEAVIGLTIIASGTSMPELATSVVAALRKQPDIALGNVIGSNVFNILGILGIASLVSPLSAPGVSWFDCATMVLFSALLLPLLFTGSLLHRIEGALLLVLYGGYLFILWPK